MDKPDLRKTARFPLPENWVVTAARCLQVWIPDDPEYLSAFLGLLATMRWSDSFARDPTKEGAATVARSWREVLDDNPIEECPEVPPPPEPCEIPVPVPGEGGFTPYDIASAIIDWWAKILDTFLDCYQTDDCNCDTIAIYISNQVDPADWSSFKARLLLACSRLSDIYSDDPDFARAIASNECLWFSVYIRLSEAINAEGEHWLDTIDAWLVDILNESFEDLSEALNNVALGLTGQEFLGEIRPYPGGGSGFGLGTDAQVIPCEYLAFKIGDIHLQTACPPTGGSVCQSLEFRIPIGWFMAGIYVKYTTDAAGYPGSYVLGGGTSIPCGVGLDDNRPSEFGFLDGDYQTFGANLWGPSSKFVEMGFPEPDYIGTAIQQGAGANAGYGPNLQKVVFKTFGDNGCTNFSWDGIAWVICMPIPI